MGALSGLSGLSGKSVTGGGSVAPVLSAIDSVGWTAQYIGTPPTFTPNTSPAITIVSRAGFTSGGATTSYIDGRVLTSRIRQLAPNDATLTANSVALDDYVYSSDSISGVTNSSAEASPKPVAQWSMAPRRLITDNLLTGGIIIDHRDGIARVEVSVTDGSVTVSGTAALGIAGRTGDQYAVAEWLFSLDITTLAAGRITLSAKVFPWLGTGDPNGADATAAGSILRSQDQTIETKSFCNLYFVKGTAYYVYVDASGVDASAAVSTSAATAAAAPALTIKGAIERARALMPSNRVSGLEIRLRSGTWTPTTVTFAVYQDANSAEVVITRDPTVARSAVTFSYSSAITWQLLYMRVQDVTFSRTANVFFGSFAAGIQLVFRDLDISITGSAQIVDRTHYYEGGIAISGAGGSFLNGANTCMVRGVSGGSSAATMTVMNYHIAGCKLLGCIVGSASLNESGGLFVSSFTSAPTSTASNGVTIASIAGTITGYILRNIVIEWTSGSNTLVGLAISADGVATNTTHFILRNVTVAGQGLAGRANLFYDEAAGTTRREHKLHRMEGCAFGQFNTKHSLFVYYSQANADAPNRTGGEVFLYGTGCRGNVYLGPDAASGYPGSVTSGVASFNQLYGGLETVSSTSTAARIDPLFVSPAHVVWTPPSTYVSGAGNGNYAIQVGSPLLGKLTINRGTSRYDAAGTDRGTSGATSAGAYSL